MNQQREALTRWLGTSTLIAVAFIAINFSACAGHFDTAGPITNDAALSEDGIPTASDNCPGTVNPPSQVVPGLEAFSCAVGNDCVRDPSGNPPRTLQNGQPVPVAANPSGSSPVLVVCDTSDNRCKMQPDADMDGAGDACDADDDNDRVPDTRDNCPLVENTSQENAEGYAMGDACDPDDDNDGVLDVNDNCRLVANPGQQNADGDSQGDACDGDDDGDNIPDAVDNCSQATNQGQANADQDSLGDACDPDDDNDGMLDPGDNCPLVSNPNQEDNDGDNVGDACDADDDNDRVPDTRDNCPLVENTSQENAEGDAMGDACDLDQDGDGRENATDNCPLHSNPTQSDLDRDGQGDACDTDCEGDGALDNEGVLPNPCGDVDLDGDGSVPPVDCLEGNASVRPGALELCNGVDDDCDGVVDDNVSTCAAGQACQDGACVPMGCTANSQCTTPPAPRCDGNTVVTSAASGTCTSGACVYAETRQTCSSGQVCAGGECLNAEAQACQNGQDDDGDGLTDCADPDCASGPPCRECQKNQDCPQGQVCAVDGTCQSPPPPGTFTLQWAQRGSVPGNIARVCLFATCDSGAVSWGQTDACAAPGNTVLTLSLPGVDSDLGTCEFNVGGYTATSQAPVWWADGEVNSQERTVGYMTYSHGTIVVSCDDPVVCTPLGTHRNPEGTGYNWFRTDADHDGDGRPNQTDAAPQNAARQ